MIGCFGVKVLDIVFITPTKLLFRQRPLRDRGEAGDGFLGDNTSEIHFIFNRDGACSRPGRPLSGSASVRL